MTEQHTAQQANSKLVKKLLLIVVGMFVFAVGVLPPMYDSICDITGLNSLPAGLIIFLLITFTGLFICFSSGTRSVLFVGVLARMFLLMATFLLTNIFLRRRFDPVTLSWSKMITSRTRFRYLMCMVITRVCLLHKCHGV